ncbi:MAG: hypothetical protein IKC13_05880 [Elusimicrobiaceae bacterium]|nr:hypothetical protein [Elusimicrobiaceae bacterium]
MEWIMIGFSYLTRLIPLAILLALASFALWLLPTYNVAMFAQLAPWAQYVSIFCFAFLTGYLGYGAPLPIGLLLARRCLSSVCRPFLLHRALWHLSR